LPLAIGFFILLLDAYTKYLTNEYLPNMYLSWLGYPYEGIGIFKDFLGIELSISHQTNLGAAWGLFGKYQEPLLYFRIFLITALLIYTLFLNTHKSWNIPLAMIIAGAIGNVMDYFIYGHVVDMIHFVFWGYDYPVFNVADSAICIGIVCLLISSFNEKTA